MFVTSTDVPVLIGRKFKYGISEEFMWAKDKNGLNWQAHVDGEYIYFTSQTLGKRGLRKTMRHSEFYELFPGI